MAQDREQIVSEFWKRVAGADGMSKTARNPESPPTAEDCPVANIFDLDDEVENTDGGRKPKNKRNLEIALELFVKGTSEAAATKELWTLYKSAKRAIFADPSDLAGKVNRLIEKRTTAVITVDAGNHMKGIGLLFSAMYTEDTALL